MTTISDLRDRGEAAKTASEHAQKLLEDYLAASPDQDARMLLRQLEVAQERACHAHDELYFAVAERSGGYLAPSPTKPRATTA